MVKKGQKLAPSFFYLCNVIHKFYENKWTSIFFQVNAMLNFLEACHYKVSCAVCQCEGRMQPHSKFQQYIEKNKDKSVSLVWDSSLSV